MSQFDSLHSLKTYSRRKQIVIPSAKVFDDVVRRDHPSLVAFDCAKQMHLEFSVEKRKRRSEGECSDSRRESTPFLFGDDFSERTEHDDKEVFSDDKTQPDCYSGGSIQNSSFDLGRKTYVSLNPFSSKGLFVDEDSNIALQDEALQVHPVAFFDKVKSSGFKKSKMQLNIENSSYLQDNAVSVWKALKSASKDKMAGKKTSGKTNPSAFSKQTGIKPKRLEKVDSRQFTQDALLKCKAVESLNHSKHNSVKRLPVSYYSSIKEAACHSGNLRKRKISLDKKGQFLNSSFTGNSDTEGNAAEDANEIECASSLNKNSCAVTKISSLKNSSALAPIDSVDLDAKAKTFVDKFTQMFGTKLPFNSKSSSKTALDTSASLEVSEKSSIMPPVSKTLQVASPDNTALLDFKMFLQFDQKNLSNSDLSPCFEDCNDTVSLVDDVASCSVQEKAGKSLQIRRLLNGKTSSVGIPAASKDKANADAIFPEDIIRTDEDTDDDCSVLLLSPLPASPVEGSAYNLSTEKLQRRNDLSSISSRHSCNNRQIHGSPKAKDAECPMTTKGSNNGRNKRRAVDDEELDKVSSQTNGIAENALNDKFQVCSEPSAILRSKFLKSARSKLSFWSQSSQQKNAEHSLKVVKSDLSNVSEQPVKTEINPKRPSDAEITLECGTKQENNDLGNYGENFCVDESSQSSDQKEISSEVNREGVDEQLLVSGENKCEKSVAKYHSRSSDSVDVGSQHSSELCSRAEVAKERSSDDSKTNEDNVCKWFRSRSSVQMVASVSMIDSYKKAVKKTEKCKLEEKSNSECIQVVGNRSGRKMSKREEVKNSPELILNASSKSETDKTVVSSEDDSFSIAKELLQTTETRVTSTKPESQFRSKTETGVAKELVGDRRSAPVHCTSYQPRSNERRLLKRADKTSNKAKALYNPRQWHGSDEAESCTETSTKSRLTKAVSAAESYDFLTSDDLPPVMTRASSFPRQRQGSDVVKIRVAREDKPLFTVVRNVKEAHECQEYGETQEFHDDVDYILDGLRCSQPLATRCLSTLSLASKCLAPAFRMHLRAHGIIPKIFEALDDTSDSMPLSLCLSAMLFMMSCDRLTIELDDISLKLVLSLLNVNSEESNDVVGGYEDFERTRLKVLELCRSVVNSSRIPFLDLRLEDMTTKFLGIEVLLSLASKLTTDWFKRSLRAVGGLRHILDAVCQSAEEFERLSVELGDAHLCLCSRAMKCLKVLDNVTFLCPENQLFVVNYKSKAFMIACDRLLTSFVRHLRTLKQKNVAVETMGRGSRRLLLSSAALSILRVLLNVTHENEHGCLAVGQTKGLVLTVLTAVVHASDIASPSQQFDLSILGLSLLLNLTENCESNAELLCRLSVETPEEKVTALEALSILFSQRYSAARLIEEVHDAKLEASEKRQQQQQQQLFDGSSANGQRAAAGGDASGHWVECESGLQWIDLAPPPHPPPTLGSPSVSSDETALSSQDDADNYTRDLHTAGRHMEDSIVAAYIALLIGSIVQGEKHLAEGFRGRLPEFSFVPLVRMLRKFLGFMNFANVSNANGNGSFHRILEILESL